MVKQLLILSVSAGAGHVRAAQALEAAAKAAKPPLQATHLDLLALVPKEFRKLYGEQYIKLVDKLPQLWSFLYAKTDRPSRDSVLGNLKRAAEKLNTRKLQAEIARLRPDAILCTHFLPAELLSRQKAQLRNKDATLPPLWVQVTDFDVHALVGASARGPVLRGQRRGGVPSRGSRRAAREDLRHGNSCDAAIFGTAGSPRMCAGAGAGAASVSPWR